MTEPPAPSHEVVTPEPTALEVEQTSNKPASPITKVQEPVPPVKFTEDSPHTATSVQDEVEILGSQKTMQDKPSSVLTKIPELEVKNEALNRGKNPVSLSHFPEFKTIDFPSMINEYFTRSSQHWVMEDSFFASLQRGYEVCFLSFALLTYISYMQ